MASRINKVHGFTHVSKTLLNEIITASGVSTPYHPDQDNGTNQPPVTHTKALWDTGATHSVITEEIVKSLKLIPTGRVHSHHAGGTSVVNTYVINLYLPNHVCVPYVQVTECKETAGRFGILIGMDVITKGDFAISNHKNQTLVSFRMPSIIHIDLSKDCIPNSIITPDGQQHLKQNGIPANTSRNALCPCGSGKKYKHCHGK